MSRDRDRAVRSTRVVLPDGVRPAAIHIENGQITAVANWNEIPDGAPVLDCGDSVVMPGLVDTHVHVNEPGRTEWEGFATATRSAAAGGVTTLVDMPLNSIPATTTRAALERKRESARGTCHVDVGFWGGVVPGNCDDLVPMADAGILGFKCFLIESGVDEFGHVGERDLRPAMSVLADVAVPLLVHAELPGPVQAAAAALANADPNRYQSFLDSRPRASENDAIDLMIRLARDTRAAVHIVHHSSSDAIPALAAARDDGLALSVETCPHYLSFEAEAIPDGATQFKCCPPIREAENREVLWGALRAGVIDMVVSDHSPCTPALKALDTGDFMAAWGGIASLQLGLAATWTQASRRGHTIEDIARWMCEAPARLAGLAHRKGRIAVGYDADLVVWNPDAEQIVDADALEHRHPVTPYAGETLRGAVEMTLLRGDTIYMRGRCIDDPVGRLLDRS